MEQHTIGDVTWIHLDEPSEQDLARLGDEFNLPSFALDVALRLHHRPRLESYDGHVLFILKPALYVDAREVVEVGQLVVVAGTRTVVTLGDSAEGERRLIRERVENDPALRLGGSAALVYAITDRIVEGYGAILDGLDTDVDEIESQVFAPVRGSHAERIYRLKSEVQEFRRAAGPLPEELDDLLHAKLEPNIGVLVGSLVDEFGDVHAKAVRAADHVANLDELLSSALHAHLAQIGMQQNNDMRRISAWVAIVAVPTAIASVYGMNFAFMPELQWRYGYFVVLGVMSLVCIALYRLFKRSGWL